MIFNVFPSLHIGNILRLCHSSLQVISHKKIFVFDELLAVPTIQALQEGDFSVSFNTLQLFTYGTVSQYFDNKASYLDLNAQQLLKLQQLSLVSLGESVKTLHYDDLMKELHVESIRALEAIIIEAIYADLIQGTMNQQQRELHLSCVAVRGVHADDISNIVASLKQWKATAETLSNQLAQNNNKMRSEREAAEERQQKIQEVYEATSSHGKSRVDDDREDGI